jgi:phosphate transport system substrate-binding protein
LWACLACTGAPAADKLLAKGNAPLAGKLVISGSSTIAPMMEAISRRFSALHPGVRIEVRMGGSGRGVDDVMDRKADIGMAARSLSDAESELYSFAIGRDGICLVVHRDNPVDSLTNRQVRDIFLGKVGNWSRVGGRDAPISAVNAKRGFAAVDLFTQYFEIKYADIRTSRTAGENEERIKMLLEDPNAILYMSVGVARGYAEAGLPLKLVAMDAVAATTRNIRSGNYPISRPLLLVTHGVPVGLAKEFINFSLSSQITDIVLQHGFVPYLD